MDCVYWHSHQYVTEIGDVDSALLADELPPEAFLDNDFFEWLKDSPEEYALRLSSWQLRRTPIFQPQRSSARPQPTWSPSHWTSVSYWHPGNGLGQPGKCPTEKWLVIQPSAIPR